ncbi:hypothetical protein HL033_04465 [Neoehrlichia mikurensis]|uniref:Uncharacterized protein n=1 Tax=Neoehrlichia mikurensis TaxID=89586 RepID=A0A9Q9F3G2_9RICK|nr:hypothetical protein [Neoehrlichia mikurensis]QXK91966.1 hypothetical protein IAH97_04465 [Neoehrlichia mikurensis]QXK93180.1 hypothetical protein HUN61_04460 [Neoehrlichia mikurensis]QXK93658.1 hypothetical protein HL033_04465 [Neoehrlichia mikurensis]UTO55385.1 hypothetical protein LUA82_04390 [Neoehrlichia mikurensis]UTO56304.1 hypothetical protein LUA81_04340 [Neoehrlichia mikurensis]
MYNYKVFAHLLSNRYYKLGYIYNFNQQDSLESEYFHYKKGGKDFYIAVGNNFKSNFYHELELRYTSTLPELHLISHEARNSIIRIMSNINNKKLSLFQIKDMLAINKTSLMYKIYNLYNINNKINLYLGYGIGFIKVIKYYGLKSQPNNHYGIAIQYNIGILYLLNKKLKAYIGYNFSKNYWKYQTNPIYDEDGNSVLYHFLNFELKSYGVDMGLMFML